MTTPIYVPRVAPILTKKPKPTHPWKIPFNLAPKEPRQTSWMDIIRR